ncbi:hypothetical protein ACVWXO_009637 [Bradyrhizobium sp. LM2.7]
MQRRYRRSSPCWPAQHSAPRSEVDALLFGRGRLLLRLLLGLLRGELRLLGGFRICRGLGLRILLRAESSTTIALGLGLLGFVDRRHMPTCACSAPIFSS